MYGAGAARGGGARDHTHVHTGIHGCAHARADARPAVQEERGPVGRIWVREPRYRRRAPLTPAPQLAIGRVPVCPLLAGSVFPPPWQTSRYEADPNQSSCVQGSLRCHARCACRPAGGPLSSGSVVA